MVFYINLEEKITHYFPSVTYKPTDDISYNIDINDKFDNTDINDTSNNIDVNQKFDDIDVSNTTNDDNNIFDRLYDDITHNNKSNEDNKYVSFNG